jgi:hypothetical protein
MNDRADMLQDIADCADALTDSRQHVEPVYTTDRSRNRKLSHVHRTMQPGLLAQVRERFEPGAQAAGFRSVPGSRPPLAFEALALHTVISLAAVRWLWSLRIELRNTDESNIRALVGAAGSMDSETQAALLFEMRTWHRRAAILTGWQTAPFRPRASCPNCGQQALVVNVESKSAFCNGFDPRTNMPCGAWWDESTVGILAEHVRAQNGDVAA